MASSMYLRVVWSRLTKLNMALFPSQGLTKGKPSFAPLRLERLHVGTLAALAHHFLDQGFGHLHRNNLSANCDLALGDDPFVDHDLAAFDFLHLATHFEDSA